LYVSEDVTAWPAPGSSGSDAVEVYTRYLVPGSRFPFADQLNRIAPALMSANPANAGSTTQVEVPCAAV
jgi:hypothetical protein